MAYRLVFDVADRIPEIALGIAALAALTIVIAAGLWAFEDLLAAWPLTMGVAIILGGLQALLDGSPSYAPFLLIPSFAGLAEALRGRFPIFDQPRVPRGGAATMFGTFLLVFDALSGIGKIGAIDLTQQLRAGRADQLEGSVEHFFEVAGGKNECLSIEDRRFCYSDWEITPGFNRTRALGGPIKPGLQVRVAAIGDTIARLEVVSAP